MNYYFYIWMSPFSVQSMCVDHYVQSICLDQFVCLHGLFVQFVRLDQYDRLHFNPTTPILLSVYTTI
jgi:hypothetical protein